MTTPEAGAPDGGDAPRVAVIVRTRDRPEFLARALRDIHAQSFRGWEVIVVNDAGDPAAVERTVADTRDPSRIRVVHLDESRHGRCAAANDGLRATAAELVVLHDDDDLWDPQFLAETVAWLDRHEGDAGVMVPTAIRYEERRGSGWIETSRVPFWEGMERVSLTDLLAINRAVPISFLYRRAIHDEVGWYDETLDAVEDWDLYLRIVPRHPIGFLSGRVLAYWSQRPAATGADANSMFELQTQHSRDDQVVRDRALAEWVAREGAGLPLYLAQLHAASERRFDALHAEIERLRHDLGRELDARHPVWSRVRRGWRRLRRKP